MITITLVSASVCFVVSIQSIMGTVLIELHTLRAGVPDVDIEQIDRRKSDPEYLEFTCLDMEAVEKLLNETVEQLSNIIKVTPSLAKVLLLEHKWKIAEVVDMYRQNATALMVSTNDTHVCISFTTGHFTLILYFNPKMYDRIFNH